ncbi:MAG TPA: hypothetical protein VFU55_13520 [Terracidiphilus sp.]|nr:hypothetical protein [Terracidiphilus sp.]
MRELADGNTNLARERDESLPASGANLEKKFRIALVLYAVLAVLVWLTMGADKVPVAGRLVEMRWLPELVLGVLVLRTVLARHAERIRRNGQQDAD